MDNKLEKWYYPAEIMANLYHRDAHLRFYGKRPVRRQRRRSAGSKAHRRQQGRAQGGNNKQGWLRIHKGRRKQAEKGRRRFKDGALTEAVVP